MSCPDWKTLAAWRDDPRAEEPAEWRQALAHLDHGCALCRRAALAADPTLVFRRLAVVPVPAPAQEVSEADAMRRAVAAMRAASRVEASERRGRRSLGSLGWKHWAAAAALALAALSIPGDDARLHRELRAANPLAARLLPGAVSEAMPAALRAGSLETRFTGAPDDGLPTVEGVDRPGARVYHMDGEGLSVVMIVDETLDV